METVDTLDTTEDLLDKITGNEKYLASLEEQLIKQNKLLDEEIKNENKLMNVNMSKSNKTRMENYIYKLKYDRNEYIMANERLMAQKEELPRTMIPEAVFCEFPTKTVGKHRFRQELCQKMPKIRP
ncbi:unnamed protein product [Adineta steineri]|uniref:Uncharacterized protein n=1 Tax=Adineta steineri TaxID=433720 RepID=A0A818U1E0_9BILA|nr:unnamed protein product [Adineta steineri]CAF3741229.1 unnamed protein product [Adineta steineri]